MSALAREQMLRSIRKALAGSPEQPRPAVRPVQAAPDEATVVDTFVRLARAAGAEVAQASDAASAREQIRRWLGRHSGGRVVCAPTPLALRLELEQISSANASIEYLSLEANREKRREFLLAADVGISDADYGLADTGTLALRATPEQGRLVSLAPAVHIALLQRGNILPDLAACFRRLNPREETARCSLLTLITGPSRTADIEQTLTVGVHGPGTVYILLVG